MVVNGGRFIWHGALGYVYQGTTSYALPLSFVVMAPISGLVDRYGLIEGYPHPVAHPSAWLLVGPYSLFFGIFLLHAVRKLAWELGARRRLWAIQVLASVIVLLPAYYWGHFEDVLALTFVLHAVRKLMAREFVSCALMLSLAISFKQTAVVLVPLIVFMAPVGSRLRTLVAACALPGALVAFTLYVDWSDTYKALFSPVNLLSGYQGHSAIYVTWLGAKTSEVSRALGFLAALAAGWGFRRVRNAPHILAALSVILLIRPFSEAINYSYYWSPALLFAGFVGVAVHRQVRWQDWIWPLLAVLWASPRSEGSMSPWWWVGEMILVCATAAQTAVNLGYRVEGRRLSRLSVKKAIQEPILISMTTPGTGETTWIR
jgi:hypothetical protein